MQTTRLNTPNDEPSVVMQEQQLQAWAEVLQAQSSVREVAVALQAVSEPLNYRHLRDLLPSDWLPYLQTHSTGSVDAAVDVAKNTGVDKSDLPSLLEGASLSLPDDVPDTLPEVLRHKAATVAGEQWIFLDADGREQRQSYRAFLQAAEHVVAGLQEAGLRPQDSVILQLDSNQDTLTAFWGCILGGFIPVIMTPPSDYAKANNELERLVHVYQHLQQPYLLTDSAHHDAIHALTQWCDLNRERILLLDAIRDQRGSPQPYSCQPDDTVFFTLTSGSTGAPKCIPLTHRNLIHRALGVNQGNAYIADDVILNWLPFDHIGSISDWNIRCVVLGCKLVYAPKEYVLGQPLNWLALIDEYRITHSWAPNFAYSLILNTLQEQGEPTDDWDLSCVKSLLTAGEAVSPTTVSDFLEGLARFSFPPHAICPAFGMAEMGSGVTYFHASADHPLCFHTLSRASLYSSDGVVMVTDDAVDAVRFTSLGPPIPGVSLRLVNEQRQPVPLGTVGYFQVKGAAVAEGYYRNPQATAESFLDDGWFDTGDLACFIDGELVICGRAKEVIIINGANYAGAEIEAVAESVAGVSVSFTAACAVNMPGQAGEALALFFVPKPHLKLERILPAIRQTLLKKLGLAPAYLLPLKRSEVPKTAIGKIQRKQLAQRLEAGQLDDLLAQVDVLLGNERTVPEWFYQRAWSEQVPMDTTVSTGLHIIVQDTEGLAEVLQQQLEACGNTCVVLAHDAPITPPQLSHGSQTPVHVWHLSGYGQDTGIDSLLSLMHALSEWSTTATLAEPVAITVVASQSQAVYPDDLLIVEKAIAPALLKSYAAEQSNFVCQHVDLSTDSLMNNARCLLQVLPDENLPEIAWRENTFYVAGLRQAALAAPAAVNTPALCSDGFYLLTGGLGGIGVELATFLLQQYSARLLLTGRSEAQGERWQSLQQLAHEVGGEVRYVALDIADTEALQHSVQQAEQDWQVTLNGVFHLAGVSGEQAVAAMSNKDLATMLYPKLSGAWAIQPLLEKRPQAWVVYSASAAGFFGGANIAAYAAANACLDALAVQQRQQGLRSYSLGWSMWDNVGMSRGTNVQAIFEAKGYCLISPKEAMRSLLIALAQDQPCLLIGLDGGKAHIRHYLGVPDEEQECVAYCVLDDEQAAEQLSDIPVIDQHGESVSCRLEVVDSIPRLSSGDPDFEALLQQTRPDLRNAVRYIAPRTLLEEQLTAIWQEVLKKNRVGVQDNFFVLGGASLQAIQCISRINQALALDLSPGALFENPTIEAIAQYVDSCVPSTVTPTIIPRVVGAPVQASFAQKRLWFLDEMEAGAAYNIPVALRLRGELNVEALEHALNCVVQRHDVLRSLFTQNNTELSLVNDVSLRLSVEDLTRFSASEQEEHVMNHARADAQQLFDLAADILLRSKLLRLSPNEHVLLLNLHHIAGDGWSVSVLAQELKLLYAAYQADEVNTLPELAIQYADFAAWQRETLQGEHLEKLLAFWKAQLEGAPELLQLPTDFIRPDVDSYQGAQQVIHIPAALKSGLRKLASRSGATLYMTLLAAFNVLLYRYSKQDDLVVGSPVACRNRAELEQLIGFFANTLALRTHLDDALPFQQLLEQVRKTAQAAYDHQDVPFEKLVEELNVKRSLAYNPLVQVLFALQNVSLNEFEFDGLRTEPVDLPSEQSLFDLELQLWETDKGLEGYFLYKTGLFTAETIERLVGNFLVLLEGIVVSPSAAISQLPLLTDTESQQLVSVFSGVADQAIPNGNVLTDIERWAADTPEALAVVFPKGSYNNVEQLTYHTLNSRANQVAHYLISLGLKPETPVGLCVDRSVEMLVGMLGILKSGGVYLPIDPAYPVERIQFILKNAKAAVLLTKNTVKADLDNRADLHSDLKLVRLDNDWGTISHHPRSNPLHAPHASQLAYIIYTSGSTGQPKGVMVEHGALASHIHTMRQLYALSPQDCVWQFSSMSFDVSLEQLLTSLTGGARLVIGQPDWSLETFDRQLRQQEVTVFDLPPAYLDSLLTVWQADQDVPEKLRLMIVGNDVLPPETVARWRSFGRSNIKLINAYGPTETTITASCHHLPWTKKTQEHRLPIGRPVLGKTAYILDAHLQPVPIGVPAELYIGGSGVARGYLHRSDLTNEKFICNPFGRGTIYKTGDLARWLPNGDIEFLGRIDHQVKLRGFRIELGEIETVLSQHESVKEAAVIVREDVPSQKQLVAYVATRQGQQVLPAALREYTRKIVPDYMVPTQFVVLDDLPKTANGKINRKALPVPALQEHSTDDRLQVQPVSQPERILVDIWGELLGLSQVSTNENFFTLGGDSILSLQLVWKAAQQGIRITPQQIFQNQTVAALARVAEVRQVQAVSNEPVTGDVPLTPIQQWFFELHWSHPQHYNQYVCLNTAPNVEPKWLEQSLAVLFKHHDGLRLRFWQKKNVWHQQCMEPEGFDHLTIVDLSEVESHKHDAFMQSQAAHYQQCFDLQDGPLMKAVLFVSKGQTLRLLWSIHHLQVDGVSWRVLLEDLETVYQQLAKGEPAVLPDKTTSFKDWSEWLHREGVNAVAAELTYWQRCLQPVQALPLDHTNSDNNGESCEFVVSLTVAETQALLQEALAAYRLQINDLLLAALVKTLAGWSGEQACLLDMEGHGREYLNAVDIDLTRTVGWFTSAFPVRLELPVGEEPEEAIKFIKEQLRQIPNKGIGYGLLRYLHKAPELCTSPVQAQISFNYLGQLDQANREASQSADSFLKGFAADSSGIALSASNKLNYLFDINVMVVRGQLHVHWGYHEGCHQRSTIQTLADTFAMHLRELIEHCQQAGAGGYTPSDFQEVEISQSELDALLDDLEEV